MDTPTGITTDSREYFKGFRYDSVLSPAKIPDSGERSEFPSAIPPRALLKLARRFEDGAAKYKRDNWKQGIPLSRYVDSLYRHLWAFMDGDDTEDHLGAIIWNAVCLSETADLITDGVLPVELKDI